MLLKVDATDFNDKDALGTGSKAEVLESTLAHELMHSVMQYTMPKQMNGKPGSLPNWFVEGTAQLAGAASRPDGTTACKILQKVLPMKMIPVRTPIFPSI